MTVPPEGILRRIPSLDGLRAVSIVLVMLAHLVGTTHFPIHDPRTLLAPVGDIGYLGVRVFFVISGYLITSLLLKEHAKTGTVSLRGFFVRRAFRIFPAAYAFVFAMVAARAFGLVQFRHHDVLHALTYTMNYHYVRAWELGHLWSLSVEEQYYLLWPAVLLLVGPRFIGHVAAGMIAAAPLMRVLAWFFMPFRDDVIMEAYPCVMDAIAAGSLLAVVQPRLAGLGWYQRFLHSPWFLLVPALVVLVNREIRVSFDYTIGITLQITGIALILDRLVSVPEGPVFRLLNTRALVWVGTLSYSLYLWQEPFLNHKAAATLTSWPLNVLLTFACALVSHHFVEKPFFGLREAWAQRRARAATAASPPLPS